MTCLLRTSGFCRAENCGGSAVPVLRQESVQLLDRGSVVPDVVQRQMVGETLAVITRQLWWLLDEFHTIFSSWFNDIRVTLGSTVDTYSASARGWLLEEFQGFSTWLGRPGS